MAKKFIFAYRKPWTFSPRMKVAERRVFLKKPKAFSPRSFISLYLPPLFWMAFIFFLSSIPHLQATSDPFWNFVTRKSAHIMEYGLLAVLIYRALGFKKAYLAILIALVYSLSDEYHQTFVPQRSGHLSDIIYDLTGILIGIGILLWKKSPPAVKKPKN